MKFGGEFSKITESIVKDFGKEFAHHFILTKKFGFLMQLAIVPQASKSIACWDCSSKHRCQTMAALLNVEKAYV